MHPGLVVLPLIAVALALLLVLFSAATSRERSTRQTSATEAAAVVFYGLIATIFLWPALSIPDGIPSPSACLFVHAPWQHTDDGSDPSTGNCALPDVTYQIQPWLLLLKNQLRAGELPLWNPYSFLGQPFWSNGQSAPLFPLHLLFTALPTMWGFLLLPWLRILIGALGTRRLALALGIGPGGALLAGVVFPLSGMITGYLLFPMANALVLVPWVLWATERLVAERTPFRTLAACVALMALGGHPGTLSHCLLLSVVYLAVRVPWRDRPWQRLGAWLGGWMTGGALAMVHLLPVAQYLPQTVRWGDPDGPPPGPGPPWTQVLAMAFRLFQPWVYGRAETGTWHGSFFEPGSRVYVGLLTLLLVGVALQAIWAARSSGSRTTDRRLLAVVTVLAFSAFVAYRTPVLLDAVESLPVVGRALHHRLLFGVELGLALLAGFGLDRLASGPAQRVWLSLSGVVAGFALLVTYLATVRPVGEVLLEQLPWLAWLVVAGASLWLIRALSRRSAPLLLLPVLLVAGELTLAHAPSVPGLSVSKLYPTTGATEFLLGRPGQVAGVGQTLRPGASVVYGLRDLRGDDPARPRRFDGMYRYLGSVRTPFFHPVRDWKHPWLDACGVRWVVTPPAGARGSGPRDSAWRLAYDGPDAQVYERSSAHPAAWQTSSDANLVVSRSSNSRVRVEGLDPTSPGRVVVTQAWAPGWRARIGDRLLDTVAHDDFLLAVDLPTTGGSVDFVYRPPGLLPGLGISLLALTVLLLPSVARRPGG
ncbi:MAG: DUF3367 domain-containing protein [Thermoanaerobaculia bacterium]|nr:DUF3367 domain-containing protein [Thermoanaerobaculia bacterium]